MKKDMYIILLFLIRTYLKIDHSSNTLTVGTLAPTNLGHSIFQALPTTRLFSEFLVWKKKAETSWNKVVPHHFDDFFPGH